LNQDCNILITSAGRRVALLRLFQQALRDLNVPGRVCATDLTANSSAYQSADLAFLSGRFGDPSYIPDLLESCQQHAIRLLVPTIDTELALYARHRDDFERIGVQLAVSDPDTLLIGSDKQRTHQWLVANQFPTPRQASIDQVTANPADWPLPLIAKPKAGSSSIGLTPIHCLSDLDIARRLDEPVVQTIAPGKEYTVDVYVDHAGKPRCAVPRMRLETRAGEVSKGITVRHSAVQELAIAICQALPGARGVLNVQIFADDKTGQLNVIECNPRFGGGYPLTHQAGAHFTHWLIEETMGLPLSAAIDQWQDGLVMLRYDDAVFVSRQQAGL